MNIKKIGTSVAAVATAAALLLGGTFAWQSISQTAINEASDIINPGGRLHNDMWYVSAEENNNDIYVENFAEDDIFARVRLEEYFEIVLNHGTDGEKPVPIIGTKTETGEFNANGTPKYDYEYVRFTGYEDYASELQAGKEVGVDGSENAYWTWQMGGETVFMPTFNMNKDSLVPDLNGIYEDGNVGTISNRGTEQYDWTEWEVDQTKTANEIWDIDSNTDDELKALSFLELADIIDNGNLDSAYEDAVQLVPEEHTAKLTQSAQLVSMTEWMSWFDNGDGTYDYSAYDPDVHGNCWVYDNTDGGDGWVYWSAKLAGGEATGLLLNGTTLNQVMDDTWYYAINAVGQFCTPDDIGDMPAATFGMRTASGTDVDNGTGFYADGETVTSLAEEFLRIIGATDENPGADEEDPSEPEQTYGMSVQVHDPLLDLAYYLVPHKAYDIEVITDIDVSDYNDTAITLSVVNDKTGTILTEDEDYTITNEKPNFVVNSDGTGYVAKSSITILDEDLVGEFVQIKAVADTSGNTAVNLIPVQWVEKKALLTFYDEGGAEVAGTNYGSTVAPNSEYDFSVSVIGDDGNEYVIFSTLDRVPVSDCVLVEGAFPWVSINNYNDVNKLEEDEDGTPVKLVVGDAETFDNDESATDSEGTVTDYDLLTFAFDVSNIKIYEDAEAMGNGAEPIEICKAYGQWNLYPAGQEVYGIMLGSSINVSQQRRVENFSIHNGNDIDITDAEGLDVSVTGNSDEGTKIVYFPATEETVDAPAQPAYYQLTIGENETATELTITASIANEGEGRKTVSLVYLNTLKIGDAPSDEWNYIYINSSSSAEKTYNLALVDYWDNAVNGVTYELSGAWVEGTKVEGNTLTLAAGENAWPMHLSVTAGGETTEYEVYVTPVDDTDAPIVSIEMMGYLPKVTISNLNDADFPLTMNAYARTGGETDEEAIFADSPYRTVIFSLTEGVVTADSDYMYTPTYADGSLSARFDVSNDGMPHYAELAGGRSKYFGLKLVAVDAAGNPSEDAKASWVEAQGCFVAGTQVQTVNGLVNIEDIKLGDMVYSIDLTTGAKVVSPVTWVQGTRYTDATYTIYAGSEKIVTTYEHPFYVIGKEWVAAEDLVVGDVIKTVDGQVTITNIVYTQLETPVQVYNFMVDGTHNYLISKSGLLVHNIEK